jgi:hypothetical protein
LESANEFGSLGGVAVEAVNNHEKPGNLRFASALLAGRYSCFLANENRAFKLNYYMNSDSLFGDIEAFSGVGLCRVAG